MPNIDLMSILPLLSGGKSPDIAQVLAAMGKAPPSAPSAPPPPAPTPTPRPSANNYADISKLYPHTPINNLPRADQPSPQQRPSMQNMGQFGGGGDMSNILQLVSAMNSSRGQNNNNYNNSSQQPAQSAPSIAPTAPREIQDSLRAILTLNELGGDRQNRR